MTNKEILIKQIIYRSSHRGTKEMDLLLGSFVKKNVYNLNVQDLDDLLKDNKSLRDRLDTMEKQKEAKQKSKKKKG